MFDLVVNFFKQGGVFLYPTALIWTIGMVIAVERFVFLQKSGSGNKRFWSELQPLLEAGNFRQAMNLAQNSETSLAQVMRYGMSRIQSARRLDDIEKAMEESLIEVIPRLEKRTHFLAALANIGLLLGLFGTVLGLIHAFAAVSTANAAEKASLLSASISVAMNNTALGLFVAISLLLCHLFLETKTTNIVDSLEVATVKFLNSLNERRADPEPQASAAAQRAQAGGVTHEMRGARA